MSDENSFHFACNYMCMLLDDDSRVWVWGINHVVFPLFKKHEDRFIQYTPAKLPLPKSLKSHKITQIAVGSSQFHFLDSVGSVWSCGYYKQHHYDTTIVKQDLPPMVRVVADNGIVLFVDTSNVCWVSATMAFDGEDDPFPPNSPFGSPAPLKGLPPMDDPFLNISLFYQGVSIVEVRAGELWTFGSARFTGRHETPGDQPIPGPLGDFGISPGPVRSLSTDCSSFYIVDNIGEVWFYKRNYANFDFEKSEPLSLTKLQGIPKMKRVVAAGSVVMYQDMENNVWVSGISSDGALGLGPDITRQEKPILNSAFGKAEDIFCCYNCSGVINENQEILVCGGNTTSGALGLGANVRNIFSPVHLKTAPKPARKPVKFSAKSARF